MDGNYDDIDRVKTSEFEEEERENDEEEIEVFEIGGVPDLDEDELPDPEDEGLEL